MADPFYCARSTSHRDCSGRRARGVFRSSRKESEPFEVNILNFTNRKKQNSGDDPDDSCLTSGITHYSSTSADPANAGTDISNSSTSPSGNISDALNGTSFASLSYDPTAKYNGDTQQQNYVLFYQQANGDIRKITYNESAWKPSEYVTSDARVGTGLSAVWFGNPPIQIYIYYIDKAGILQELRGEHASGTWNNGTLGATNFKAVDSYSALSAQFQGRCAARGGQLGWVFYESAQGVQEARWQYDNDTWVMGNRFQNIKSGSSFVSTIAGGPVTAWRLFGVRKDLAVQEYACDDCCGNSTHQWGPGTLTFLSGLFPQARPHALLQNSDYYL